MNKTFKISIENSLGFSHYGEVVAYGNGEVEFTDEEVQQLVDLIRENGGETDVDKLHLEECLPDIYDYLDETYRDLAWRTVYNHWVVEGYENGYYEDTEDAIEKAEAEYGFVFEFDEAAYRSENEYDEDEEIDEDELEDAASEARENAFFEWVEARRSTLEPDQEASFLSDLFGLEPEIVDGVEYTVEIPEEIVKMAEG